MKQIEKKDSSEVSGGVGQLVVVDDPNPGCITLPDFPQSPIIGDPFGEGDLPAVKRG